MTPTVQLAPGERVARFSLLTLILLSAGHFSVDLYSGALGALAAVQVAAAAAPFLVCAFLQSLAGMAKPAMLAMASQALFPLLAAGCGAIGGWQFAIASRLYFAGEREESRGLGALYAIDLAGACLGALAQSAWVIPVFGFLNTAAVIAMVALAPALSALLCARRIAAAR